MTQLIDGELTDRVWNLPECKTCIRNWCRPGWVCSLEEDRDEPSVEIAHSTFTQKTRETGDQPGCVSSLRHHADTRGFEWRQEYVRKEPGHVSIYEISIVR